jgi:uroporphyrinogen decarboxylase
MFLRFVAPYLREMVERIHSLGGLVLFHSCGRMEAFIPDLLELGIDILDPIQPVCPEMSPESLAARYGDRLAFHGGIDMQGVLPHGSPEEVRREVRRYRDAFAGGGYILSPAHLFQPDVPPGNVLAMYEAAR